MKLEDFRLWRSCTLNAPSHPFIAVLFPTKRINRHYLTIFYNITRRIIHSGSGQVPPSLWTLSKLKTLIISSTRLYDSQGLASLTLPSPTPMPSIGPFPDLENLTIEYNAPIVAVTTIMRTSLGLKHLVLRGHELIPPLHLIQGLSSLTYLDISQSSAKGTLMPEFWRSLPALEHVNMSSTSINGELYSSIGTLSHLRVLDMSRNKIGGYLPTNLALCPLEWLILEEPAILHPLPDFFEYFGSTMTHLSITSMQGGENRFPQSIGELRSLKTLTLSKCGFTGSLPANLSLSLNLKEIRIDNNRFQGTIPSFASPGLVDVHNNELTGTIPKSIASSASILILGHNRLGPTISAGLLSNSSFVTLDLSHNQFSGPLPNLLESLSHTETSIDLSYNEFNGTIPNEYCQLRGLTLQLSNNQLAGPLNSFLSSHCGPIHSLHLEKNNFEGGFPEIQRSILSLDISHNKFSGALPLLPFTLKEFKARSCGLTDLDFGRFALSASQGVLERLDLSGLNLSPDESYFDLMGPRLQELSLADNNFRSTVEDASKRASPSLVGIDLTNNSLSGLFPIYKFNNGLAVLKIAHNQFNGGLDLSLFPSLTQVDISYNQFRFDVADFKGLPLLMTINARSNSLYGALMMDATLENLQSADFSQNALDQHLDLASIGSRYSSSQLHVLNVSSNIFLPPFQDLNTNNTGLARTSSSAPSPQLPTLLTCYALSFFLTDDIFLFDEELFNYTQCDCNQGHFGRPPMDCYKCPPNSLATCGATRASIQNNSYAFFIGAQSALHGHSPKEALTNGGEGASMLQSLWSTLTGSEVANTPSVDIYNDRARDQLLTESCLVTTVQTLSHKSNCKGINITTESLQSADPSEAHLLKSQCRTGSEGRLCSKCQCNATGECWYQRGPICSKCKYVFPLSSSIPLVSGLLLLTIVVLSVIMALTMRGGRVQSLVPYAKLPIIKRIFYRFLHLTSLGHVSILITFVQILIAFTEWDAHMQVGFLGLINGECERYGSLPSYITHSHRF